VIGLRRDLAILACAVSAGAHGALAPEHWAEGTAAGIGFAGSTVLLAAAAVALWARPASRTPVAAAALLFSGLLAAYAVAATTGIPLVHPESEPLDGLALATKACELVGLAAALGLLRDRRPAGSPRPIPLALAALVGLFAGLTALAFSEGHEHQVSPAVHAVDRG
jgi:drug/metabolite transporter (DMT)-like permease